MRSRLLLAGALLLASACSRKIGDSCKTSADCSLEAERNCDISQPGGYCTIEGCDERSCPDEAVCIRFFPRLFVARKCVNGQGCNDDEICLPDGDCAPRNQERRFCALKCSGGSDCRDNYECRAAGTEGSLPLVKNPDNAVRFCAPSPR